MKWKNIDLKNKKTTKYSDEVSVDYPKTKEDYHKSVKKYHPDINDPFFKNRNTKKMQKLNQNKDKLK